MNKKVTKITSSILLCSILAYTVPVLAYTKEESVYSKLDANGACYQTTVSDHLKNTDQEEFLKDLSDLMNIENVSGDQELQKENNSLTWKAEGDDIYYQGTTEKELPIECKIIYELDGKEISKEEIVGKSGKVKITLEYTNKEERKVTINGKKETMYVPFVVGVGTIIDNENNKNIEVTNGKVMDDGTKTIVFGIALPGMQESLDLAKEKIEIPSKVEITMEAKDFEMSEIYAFATPKILGESDLDVFDELDNLYSKINTLQSSANQLEEGANTLKEGTTTYYEKSQEFNEAMGQITSGINSANTNYTKINQGITSLRENSSALTQGAKTISEGTGAISENLVTVNEKVGLLEQGTEKLLQGETKLNAGLDQIITSVGQVTTVDNTTKIAQLEELVKNNDATIAKLKTANATIKTSLSAIENTEENSVQIETLQTQIATNTSLITLLETNNTATKQTISTLETTDISSMKQLQAGLTSLKDGVTELQTGTKTLNDGLVALEDGTKTLAEKSQELTKGSKTLYQGTEKMLDGTKTLSTGSTQIKQGLNTLDSGSNKLQVASNSLVEGAGTINEGATTLAEGMTKFNKEGIEVLCNTINGEVKDLQVRLEKLQDLASEYNTFTMMDENAEGSVKFIMMIDSLKKEEKKEQVILPSEVKEEKEN